MAEDFWAELRQPPPAADDFWAELRQPAPRATTAKPTQADIAWQESSKDPVIDFSERAYKTVRDIAAKVGTVGVNAMLPKAPFDTGGMQDGIAKKAVDFVLPETLPAAMGSVAMGGLGSALSPAMKALTGAFRAVRPLKKELATEALAKLLPEDALAAKQWYEAAGKSGQTVPMTEIGHLGSGVNRREFPVTTPKTFEAALESLQGLKKDQTALMNNGRTAAAHALDGKIGKLTDEMDAAFPGFKGAQGGYAKLRQSGRLQELTEGSDPLKAFEKDITKGRVAGPNGEILIPGGGRATHSMKPEDIEDARKILAKLGKEPAEGIWQKMIEGKHIATMAMGAAGGYQSGGGHEAAAAGALLGIGGPKAINWALAQGLKAAPTRQLIKRTLAGGGLANPRFWQALSFIGTRHGLDMTPPDESN